MKARNLGLAALVGLILTTSAFANSATITLDPQSWDYVSYGFVDQYGNYQSQFVAPYPVTVVSGGLSGNAALACYDINNPNFLGGTYSGQIVYSTTTAEKEISWLGDQVRMTPLSDSATLGALSNAMWELGFPSSTNSKGGYLPIDPAAQPWIAQAQTAVANGYKPDILIFIPDDASTQRFGFISSTIPLSAAPEPGSLLLMGSALLGAGSVLRRRLKS